MAAPIRLKPSLDWLFIAAPLAAVVHGHGGSASWVFVLSCLGIIPAARWLGIATEHIASRTTAGLGGLLNATFGNAAELIIGLIGLHAGLPGLVKASITGSIIGNLLLVLGGSCLWGGLKHHRMRFNVAGISAYSSMLFLAATALLLPATVAVVVPSSVDIQRHLSLQLSVILITVYLASLLFSLRTHRRLFDDQSEGAGPRTPVPGAMTETAHATATWSMGRSLATMLAATAVLGLLAEWMVGSVHQAAATLGMSSLFVGVIIVSMVGNAAEHSSALLFARRNRMDLAMAIAIGSSIQIALLVAPLLVFASYWLAPQPLDLLFTGPEILAIVLAVLVTEQVIRDGETHWLEGVQLLSVYVVLAFLFHALPDGATATPGQASGATLPVLTAPAAVVAP